MKKLFYVFAAATLLLQACSTGSNFSKKRYGHLSWINHNAKVEMPAGEKTAAAHNTPAPAATEERSSTVIAVQTETPAAAPVVADQTPAVQNTPVQRTATHRAQPAGDSPVALETNEQVTETPAGETFNDAEPLNEKISAPVKPMMDEDVKLIVCIILAIIIPPLGMYLWDEQTDKWFVIDLILYLCWFLWIFGPFGLLGLGSIVIALLRVFDQI